MSEPGRDQRDVDDSISAAKGQSEIGRMINAKIAERAKLQKQIDVIDGEITGLREAEFAIERLGMAKRAAANKT